MKSSSGAKKAPPGKVAASPAAKAKAPASQAAKPVPSVSKGHSIQSKSTSGVAFPSVHDGLKKYLTLFWEKKSRLSCGSWATMVMYGIVMLPFILEGSVLAVALGLIIPFAFSIALLKNCSPLLWILVSIFVNIGGLSDVATDVTLLAKGLINYMGGEEDDTPSFVDEESMEENLMFARTTLTLFTGIPGLFVLLFSSHFRSITSELEGTKKEKSSTTMSNHPIFIIGVIVAWKLLIGGIRVFIIKTLASAYFKHRKIDEQTEHKVQWMESFAMLDVLWSGIPLGALTAYELFFVKTEELGEANNIIEMTKLVALAIDILAIAYLLYFEIFGLEHRVCGGHHHQSHELHQDTHEKKPLLEV